MSDSLPFPPAISSGPYENVQFGFPSVPAVQRMAEPWTPPLPPAWNSIVPATTAPKAAPLSAPMTTSMREMAPTTTAPIAAPMTATMAAPMAVPMAAPMAAPMTAPMAVPMAVPMVAQMAASMAAPMAAPMAVPMTALMTAPMAAPMAAQMAEPMAAPMTAPTTAPTTAPMATPSLMATPPVAPTSAAATPSVPPAITSTTPNGIPLTKNTLSETSCFSKQSALGFLKGSTLSWISLSLIVLSLILHAIAVALPLWSRTMVAGSPSDFGLWQTCQGTYCSGISDRYNTGVFKTIQVIAVVVIVTMVTTFIIFLCFLGGTKHKTARQVFTIGLAIITAFLILIVLSAWDIKVRSDLSGQMGTAFILEVICFILELILAVVCTIDFLFVTKKMTS